MSERPEAESAERIQRREALKKAAAGAAISGAVWAGPKVEGLSLVPDYASAGTAAAGTSYTFVIDSGLSDGPASFDIDNGGSGTGCNPIGGIYGNDWAAVSPAANPGATVTSPQPNARNNPINIDYVYPSPSPSPAANVDVLIPSGWDADLNNNEVVTLNFTVDPPWNKCRINAVSMNRCDGSVGNVNIGPGNPPAGSTNPGPSSPFSVDVQVGPQPSNMARLRITVSCA